MAELILVVEDDLDICDNIRAFLESEGFDVVTADNGAAALDYLRGVGRRPKIITLDLMMPKMNGWDFRAHQLKDPNLNGIPVIVLSAALKDTDAFTSCALVKKPVDLDLFLNAVKQAIAAAD